MFFILGAVIITVAASTGFLVIEEEKDGLKLWQPSDSDFVKDTSWLRETFPSKSRFSSILILADNVLEPKIVKQMHALMEDIRNIKNASGHSMWEQKCMRTAFQKCLEMSILEVFDPASISSLSTLKDVTDVINTPASSSVTGAPFNPKAYVGSIAYSGEVVVGAKAMLLNLGGVNDGDQEGDEVSMLFEEKLLTLVNTKVFADGMEVYPLTMRSFGDLIGGSIASDLNTLAAGYLLIFIYVLINLGKLNSIEQRVWLSVAGIVAVMMGVATSFGLSAHMGVFTSGMNQLLPFLMLGIGIDDMFVIMAAFGNLTPEEREMTLPSRMGETMKHAGVAITITSITDLLAFAIGASTVLPALSSFCIYAALGILFIYLYVITFFLAWLSLDQRRVEDTRDGCVCCWKRKEWTPSECSQKSVMKTLFEKLAGVMVLLPAKVIVLLVTLGILAGGLYGAVTLDTYFDNNDFIEKGSYLRNHLELKGEHFPEDGQASNIYLTDLDYAADMENIGNMLDEIMELSNEGNKNIAPGSIKSWFKAFVSFVNQKRASEFGSSTLPTYKGYTNDNFLTDLSEFLGNPAIGGSYRGNFKYAAEIDYSKPAPKVLLSSISYKHVTFEHSNDGIVAMKDVFAIVDKYSFSGNVFATSQSYGSYLTIDIITGELIRNVLMALGVVFVCTLILIADLATSIIVLLTVSLTIVDVAGFANFWGLNIDTLFAIFMTISIGLCVDYSAHIAHGFMVVEGSRDERMRKTLINTGPAVLNGGISTFLAFVLLSLSKSIIFLTFFKIFFLVVAFGLFHGLLFLPVVLSLVGPKSHHRPNGQKENYLVQAATAAWAEKNETGQVFEPDKTIVSQLSNSLSLPSSVDTEEIDIQSVNSSHLIFSEISKPDLRSTPPPSEPTSPLKWRPPTSSPTMIEPRPSTSPRSINDEWPPSNAALMEAAQATASTKSILSDSRPATSKTMNRVSYGITSIMSDETHTVGLPTEHQPSLVKEAEPAQSEPSSPKTAWSQPLNLAPDPEQESALPVDMPVDEEPTTLEVESEDITLEEDFKPSTLKDESQPPVMESMSEPSPIEEESVSQQIEEIDLETN